MKKVDQGDYSDTWMAKDCKSEMIVSIKIHKSAPCYLENAFDECEMLQFISSKVQSEEWAKDAGELLGSEAFANEAFVVRLLNSFVHFGPMGNHFCMAFEILGPSLQDVIDESANNNINVKASNHLKTPSKFFFKFQKIQFFGIFRIDLKWV